MFLINTIEFFEMHKNGNNDNIGSKGFTMWKQKI